MILYDYMILYAYCGRHSKGKGWDTRGARNIAAIRCHRGQHIAKAFVKMASCPTTFDMFQKELCCEKQIYHVDYDRSFLGDLMWCISWICAIGICISMAGLERLLGPMANAVLGHRRSFDKERGDQVVQVNKIWTGGRHKFTRNSWCSSHYSHV